MKTEYKFEASFKGQECLAVGIAVGRWEKYYLYLQITVLFWNVRIGYEPKYLSHDNQKQLNTV